MLLRTLHPRPSVAYLGSTWLICRLFSLIALICERVVLLSSAALVRFALQFKSSSVNCRRSKRIDSCAGRSSTSSRNMPITRGTAIGCTPMLLLDLLRRLASASASATRAASRLSAHVLALAAFSSCFVSLKRGGCLGVSARPAYVRAALCFA